MPEVVVAQHEKQVVESPKRKVRNGLGIVLDVTRLWKVKLFPGFREERSCEKRDLERREERS